MWRADSYWLAVIRWFPDLLLATTYGLVALACVWLMPETARLDRDEGFNIMKAALVDRGYVLYREIWSDQPPLFTWMLVGWREMFGESDASARSLVVLLTTLGLMSVGRIAGRLSGAPWAGLLAVALVIGARAIPKLSMSVMIGLPAVSVALMSVWLILEASRVRWGTWLMPLAGAVFACSMQIKLFTFILAPFALVLLWTNRTSSNRSTAVRSLQTGLVLAGFGLITWVIGPFDDPAWQKQMIDTHLKSGLSTDDSQLASIRSIVSRFLEDAPLMIATVVMMILAGRQNLRAGAPALLWLLTSVLVLSQANPLWGHHRVMFSIPAAILCACAAAAFWRESAALTDRQVAARRKVAIGVVGFALLWGAGNLVFALVTLGRTSDDTMNADTIAELRSRAIRTRWIITDDPHLVHSAGLIVPPETAVISLKRLQKDLSEPRLIELIDRYHPELVLLARHRYSADFEREIAARYELVLRRNDGRIRLFEKKSDAPDTAPPAPAEPASRPVEP